MRQKNTLLRRLFSIFALLLMLATNSELYQLVKLPVLLEHYREHREGDGLNFWGFLQQHYFSGEQRQPDYERDMQLPFKTPHFISSISLLLAVPEQPIIGILPAPHTTEGGTSRYSEWLPATFLQDIFQPPRA